MSRIVLSRGRSSQGARIGNNVKAQANTHNKTSCCDARHKKMSNLEKWKDMLSLRIFRGLRKVRSFSSHVDSYQAPAQETRDRRPDQIPIGTPRLHSRFSKPQECF